MTEQLEDGATVAVRLPGGVVSAEVGSAVMGPPGLRGQRGERGDPGGTTTIVFSFSQRTPAELPDDGLIFAGWDDVRVPEADIQVGIGQSVEYRGDGYLYLFLGPSTIPGGWIETGQMRGPPGDQGPIGDTGPAGPIGDRGLTGNTGAPGPKGDQGDTGPQGARGADGAPGQPGATGPVGPTGSQGPIGPVGPQGDRGDPGADGSDGADGADGQPGAPSFVIDGLITRTASELASQHPTGLILANFDGPGRPPVDYQMKIGEAWLATAPGENPSLAGQAIVFVGTVASPNPWIAMSVTGPKGDQGDQGDQGPQGIQGVGGPMGPPGNLWHWFPIDPPTPGIGVPGDMVLILNHGNPDMPGNGNVYRVIIGGGYTLDGNLRGPAGPQGPPGEVSWADIIPIVNRIDGLEARLARLEFVAAETLVADKPVADEPTNENGADVILWVTPIQQGDHLATATFTFALEKGTDVSAANRIVTAWVEPVGSDVVISGNRAGQVTLHQALPAGSVTIGPMRLVVNGPTSVVCKLRADRIPDEGGVVLSGRAMLKAATFISGKAGATGLVAR
jgi:hypothetical protein